MDNKDLENPKAKATPYFKLKDKEKRTFKIIRLKELFGFCPEIVVVEKEHAKNNSVRLVVILTEKEIKKEEKRLKKAKSTSPDALQQEIDKKTTT